MKKPSIFAIAPYHELEASSNERTAELQNQKDADIRHIHSEYNVFRDAFQLTGTPTVIYNSVGELYFHNLTSADTVYFPLLDDCQRAITRLKTEQQVHIVRHSGRNISQINGHAIHYEDEFLLRLLPEARGKQGICRKILPV